MLELLHNGMHPLDLDGLMFAFGQMGLLYSYGVSTLRRLLDWRPWRRGGLQVGADVTPYHMNCGVCGDPYHGEGVDYARYGSDGDEMKVIAPDPCGVDGCRCPGEDAGLA